MAFLRPKGDKATATKFCESDGDDDATATEEGAVVMERVKATYQSIREAFDRGW